MILIKSDLVKLEFQPSSKGLLSLTGANRTWLEFKAFEPETLKCGPVLALIQALIQCFTLLHHFWGGSIERTAIIDFSIFLNPAKKLFGQSMRSLEKGRERMCVCEWPKERERERVRANERVRVCFEREREREWTELMSWMINWLWVKHQLTCQAASIVYWEIFWKLQPSTLRDAQKESERLKKLNSIFLSNIMVYFVTNEAL